MSIDECRAANPKVAKRRRGNWPQKIDITLDVSVGVLTTLKDVAKISPVPFLSNAASIALSIVNVVQKVRNNKREFKELANDSCEIVCEVIDTHRSVLVAGDVPIDLEEDLEDLVDVLHSIKALARKGATRNVFVAVLRYNLDARRIQDYQRKLAQAIQIFGLRSHLSTRKTIAQLAANQAAMANQLNNITAPVHVLPILPTSRISFETQTLKSEDSQTSENNFSISKLKLDRQDEDSTELGAKHALVPLSSCSTSTSSLIKSTQAQTMTEQHSEIQDTFFIFKRQDKNPAELLAKHGFVPFAPCNTSPDSLIKSTRAQTMTKQHSEIQNIFFISKHKMDRQDKNPADLRAKHGLMTFVCSSSLSDSLSKSTYAQKMHKPSCI